METKGKEQTAQRVALLHLTLEVATDALVRSQVIIQHVPTHGLVMFLILRQGGMVSTS